MSKGAYIGVNGVARKIKKGYIGIDGVARKIKKAYIGVGGIARPCWNGGKVTYYGTATPLTSTVSDMGAATFDGKAFFGGGKITTSSASKNVDMYDKNLTKTTTELSQARYGLKATASDDYIAFGAGAVSSTIYNTIDVFNKSLTRTPLSDTVKRTQYGAATAGNLLIFAGGHESAEMIESRNLEISTVTAVDLRSGSATVIPLDSLPNVSSFVSAVSLDDWAIFAGGSRQKTVLNSDVVRYNASGTQYLCTILKGGSSRMGATRLGNQAIFAGGLYYEIGGSSGSKSHDFIYSYTKSGTQTQNTKLTVARGFITATTLEDKAIMAGGLTLNVSNSKSYQNTVECIDESLTATVHESPLSKVKAHMGAATVGDKALFVGGRDGGNNVNGTVDVYTIV